MRLPYNKKSKNDYGLSLVELIAVISIIAVMTGIVAPQVVKYVESNRTKACVQNRDAILNVFSKGVYGMHSTYNLDNDDSVQDLIDAGDSDEYSRQAMLYTSCPSHGSYSGYIKGDKAYVVCSEHDDVCVVDFTGWSGEGWEAADGGYPSPSQDVDPFPTTVTDSPEPTKKPPVKSGDSGVWPYPYTVDGNVDPRWMADGTAPTSGSTIYIPYKCGFFTARSGADYILTESLGSIWRNGIQCVELQHEKATSPENLMLKDTGFIVKTSGLHYTAELITQNGNNYVKSNDELPPIGQLGGGSELNANNFYYFSYGDMLTVKYGDKYKTYVMLARNQSYAKIPNSASEKTFGSLDAYWAVVPEQKCIGYQYDADTKEYTATYRKLMYSLDDRGNVKVEYGEPYDEKFRLN